MSSRVLDALEAFVLPARCPACGAEAAPLLCRRCALQLEAYALPDLGAARLAAGVRAVGAYAYAGVAADVVRGLKLGGRWSAAAELGAGLRRRVALPPGLPVTWVPSTPRRRRQRGVELPRLLAGPGAVRLLAARGERPDQTSLSAAERLRNPRGAFTAIGAVPPAVVLIDDVRTTGATATAAATALQEGGARRVLVVTFAVAGEEARDRARS